MKLAQMHRVNVGAIGAAQIGEPSNSFAPAEQFALSLDFDRAVEVTRVTFRGPGDFVRHSDGFPGPEISFGVCCLSGPSIVGEHHLVLDVKDPSGVLMLEIPFTVSGTARLAPGAAMPGAQVEPAIVTSAWMMKPGPACGPDAVRRGINSTTFEASQWFAFRSGFSEVIRVMRTESVGPTSVTHKVMGTTFNNAADNYGVCCYVTPAVPGRYELRVTVRVERTGAVSVLRLPYDVLAGGSDPVRQVASGTVFDPKYVYEVQLIEAIWMEVDPASHSGTTRVLCGPPRYSYSPGALFHYKVSLNEPARTYRVESLGPVDVVHATEQTPAGGETWGLGADHAAPSVAGKYILRVTATLTPSGAVVVTDVPYEVTTD